MWLRQLELLHLHLLKCVELPTVLLQRQLLQLQHVVLQRRVRLRCKLKVAKQQHCQHAQLICRLARRRQKQVLQLLLRAHQLHLLVRHRQCALLRLHALLHRRVHQEASAVVVVRVVADVRAVRVHHLLQEDKID